MESGSGLSDSACEAEVRNVLAEYAFGVRRIALAVGKAGDDHRRPHALSPPMTSTATGDAKGGGGGRSVVRAWGVLGRGLEVGLGGWDWSGAGAGVGAGVGGGVGAGVGTGVATGVGP